MASLNRPVVVTPTPPPPTAAVTTANDLRDIKPPVEIPSGWAWLAWLLAAAILAALAVWAWRRWRKQRARLPAAVVIPPHVRAKQKLAEALALIQDARLFCIVVSDALRVYLEERFNYRAPERTTEEFLVELQSSTSLYPDQKQSLAEFLENCDLVKFARFEPTETALRELHESALRLVEETQFEKIQPAANLQEAAAAS